MRLLKVSMDRPQITLAIQRAARVLGDGGLVAFPTDTVYGVAAAAFDARAIERLFEAKGRDRDKAVPVLLAQAGDLNQVAVEIPQLARSLGSRFWPGPLTMVLKRHPRLPSALVAGGDTIATRVPDHPIALALLKAAGGVLAVSSANRSGEDSPRTAHEVVSQLRGRIDLLLDGGDCPGGVASTVVDLTTSPLNILRDGPIGKEKLQAVIGDNPTTDTKQAASERHMGMKIALGSDHAGYALKSEVAAFLADLGYDVVDLGTEDDRHSVHYPEYGKAVAQAVASGTCDLGIAICGTGIGVSIAANKVHGARAALCTDTYMARMSRQHNDANVLCLGGRVVGTGLALDIVASWLKGEFEGGRHATRVAMFE